MNPSNPAVFVCGVITEVTSDRLIARPLTIGHLVEDCGGVNPRLAHMREVRAEEFDAFKRADFTMRVSEAQLRLLKNVSEAAAKQAFAEAFAEPFVEKDWGGEQADLFTTQPKINGERVSCAFAFKGPGHFKKLHPAGCGKNGDQLPRLFSLPASVYVLQHCHAVGPHVRRIMQALTMERLHENIRFCIIDGYQTYSILTHLKKLPKAARSRAPRRH
ncbi:MAG: hypothetical protein ACREIA_26495 [Opitutaceae bacterium]